MFPVNICHAWTTVEEVVVVGEHQGKSSVLRFYLHKMMGLAMSRSKCRPLGPRDFPLKFHYGVRPHGDTTLHARKTPPRSLSKCILKKRRGRHHSFSPRLSRNALHSIPPSFLLKKGLLKRVARILFSSSSSSFLDSSSDSARFFSIERCSDFL